MTLREELLYRSTLLCSGIVYCIILEFRPYISTTITYMYINILAIQEAAALILHLTEVNSLVISRVYLHSITSTHAYILL